MDELFEGMQYWRRDGSVSPPLVLSAIDEVLRDPETSWLFTRRPRKEYKLGHVFGPIEDDKDLVAPYMPVGPTEEALQALL